MADEQKKSEEESARAREEKARGKRPMEDSASSAKPSKTSKVDGERSNTVNYNRPYRRPGSVGGWRWVLYGLRGMPPVYLGEKEATGTDVNPKHSRLLISSCMEQSLLDFLTEEERCIVSRVSKKKEEETSSAAASGEEEEERSIVLWEPEKEKKTPSTATGKRKKNEKERKESVAVRVIDERGNVYGMSLTRWCNNSLNLTGRWMWFAAKNGLVEGQAVRMWASRLPLPGEDGDRLCLLLKLQDPYLLSMMHELEKEPSWHVLRPRD